RSGRTGLFAAGRAVMFLAGRTGLLAAGRTQVFSGGRTELFAVPGRIEWFPGRERPASRPVKLAPTLDTRH
ncbi:MAG: hypothetical protein KDB22_30475, partial [Planctomycetales bacterium]|nr:hypothetical protein [Planctomycetales bacterium]